jgi:hypothetical protein
VREIKEFGERDPLKMRIVIMIENLSLSYSEGWRPFFNENEVVFFISLACDFLGFRVAKLFP